MSSIHDVAREAGVSTATVSRTFSTPTLLSHQTRRRVLEAAERLDYRPRQRPARVTPGAGQAPATPDCLGFLLFSHAEVAMEQNEFYGPLLMGAQTEAARLGMHLITATVSRYAPPQDLPRMFRQQAVAGMLLVGAALPDVLAALAPHLTRAVLVDNHDAGHCLDSVLSDGFGGAYRATQYLIGLGHRRIAFLLNEPTAPTFQDRLRGYLCAHFEAGLTPDPRHIVSTGPDEDAAPRLRPLFEARDGPTSLVAANDINAFHVMRICRAAGRRIPEDLSLIGFDDIPFSVHAYPPLTTVRVDKEYMGRLAVRQLHARVQQGGDPTAVPDPPVQIVTPVALVERESCRPPAGTPR